MHCIELDLTGKMAPLASRVQKKCVFLQVLGQYTHPGGPTALCRHMFKSTQHNS